MTEHLPECPTENAVCHKAWPTSHECVDCRCICPELRACEQRMREEHRHRCSGCDWCYSDGVLEALDAARKAVSALPEYRMRDTCIAAIEQLREEKK